MPTVLCESELSGLVEGDSVIKNGVIASVEGIKYDFRLSSRILKSSYRQPIDINNLPEMERAGISVEPGEVVFVLTEEELTLPMDVFAVLSPKRKLSHEGHVPGSGVPAWAVGVFSAG